MGFPGDALRPCETFGCKPWNPSVLHSVSVSSIRTKVLDLHHHSIRSAPSIIFLSTVLCLLCKVWHNGWYCYRRKLITRCWCGAYQHQHTLVMLRIASEVWVRWKISKYDFLTFTKFCVGASHFISGQKYNKIAALFVLDKNRCSLFNIQWIT